MSKLVRRRPIFSDPHGRRAKVTNAAFAIATAAFFVTATVLIFGIAMGSRASVPAHQSPASTSASGATDLLPPRPLEQPPNVAVTRRIPDGASKALRLAFLSTDEQSGSPLSLKKHAHELDAVIPEWLELGPEPGGVRLRQYQGQAAIVDWIRGNAGDLMIFPEITSTLTRNELFALLAKPAMRISVIGRIVDYLRENDFPGVVIDTRLLGSCGYRLMALFLDELASKLRGASRKVIFRVAPDTDEQKLREMSGMADYVIAATENENNARPSTREGASAAQAWFEDRLRAIVAAVPPSKLIVSIGSYGFDIDSIGISEIMPVQRAWDRMAHAAAKLSFDGRSLNPTFAYDDGLGHQHRVWLLDATTAFNQVKAALSLKPAGLAVWRLGLEDPAIWASFGRGRVPDDEALKKLKTPQPGYGSYGGSQGMLISAEPGSDGERNVLYNRSLGLITDANLTRVPQQARQTVWRARDPTAVALTFDDGPGPKYTGRILDVLAAKGVKATFYVIGREALESPNLIKRMYAEGHDIGNHTFSHPNPIGLSSVRLTAELNATARIVESIAGVRLHLFRPPYAGPGFAYLDADPSLARRATALGYMIGELGVESCDWCSISAPWIVRNVMNGVLNKHGRIVLMHDGGGNREATIAALPMVIDRLRAAGFHFVTTHELVGLSRDAVMQPLRSGDILASAEGDIWRGAIAVSAGAANVIRPTAIGTALLGIFRLALIIVLAVVQSRRRRMAPARGPYRGTVTVLVPAYNERTVICKTVRSILSSTIAERLQVVVIDDGSSDGTSKVVRAEFAADPRVVVLRKKNGGKSAALNRGIERTDADVIVAIDGDTMLLPDAIERLIAHFADASVGAVAGNVVVGNRNNLLTRFQALEYVTSQNLDRRAFELFRAVGVVPGAIGAWRRTALLQAGGYANDTLAEDADLTLALQRLGWRIVAEPTALALTEAPETLRAFMKQRFRWMFGTLQVASKHVGALRERPGGISLVALPNAFLFQFAFSLVAPIMDALLLSTLLLSASAALFQTSGPDGMLALLAAYWLLFQAIDISAALVGIALEPGRGHWRLVPLVILQRFTYRQLLYVTAVRALLAALKGRFVGWGKLVRTGNVAIAIPRAD
jgi:cellulose synthase/poly-beta-1,6-N-acetylglucosamine synthase-like glycosyltransferase/peptidoglycan/xylan/chitin deacetylase (PgdA/CDA1 family)